MNYYEQNKLNYLLQFYSMKQIHDYCNFSIPKFEYLWEQSQPYEIEISKLNPNFDTNFYLVDSPDGYVPIEEWRNKGKKKILKISTTKTSIKSSDDHLFQLSDNSWIYSKDLKIGDKILSSDGFQTITNIENLEDDIVFDLAIGHENHRYYTNELSSHNSGKSLFLQNLSLNWAMTGKTVVYISLELSQKMIAERFDAMISGRGTKAIYKDIEETAFEIAKTGKNSGKIFIKRMREGTNTNDIRAYLNEFKIKMGFTPDVVMLDYLDLLHPNNKRIDVSNLFIKDKYTSEEFRGLLEEGQFLSATACQLNRDSFGVEGQFTQAHLAGGISKMNTADNAFGIYVTNEMKEAGKYKTVVLKARTSNCVNEIIEYGYNNRTMRIVDPMPDIDKPTPRNEIKNDVKASSVIIKQEEPQKTESLLEKMHKRLESKNST